MKRFVQSTRMLFRGIGTKGQKVSTTTPSMNYLLRRRTSPLKAGQNTSTVAGQRSPENEVKPFSDIPGPKGWPILGTLPFYISESFDPRYFHHRLLDLYDQYGSVYKECMNGKPSVHIFDPELACEIYRNEGKYPLVPPLLEASKEYRAYRGMSVGLGNLNGPDWARLRTASQGILMKRQNAPTFLPHSDEVTKDFIQYLEAKRDVSTNEVHDIHGELKKWSFESTSLMCFETRMGAFGGTVSEDHISQEMIHANDELFNIGLKLKFSLPWHKVFPTQAWKDLIKAEDTFYRHGQAMVDEAVQTFKFLSESDAIPDGKYAMLAHMLSKDNWTYDEFSVTVLTVVADSLIATVNGMINLLYCLATNPMTQDKLYEEIRNLGLHQELSVINKDSAGQMKYFRACLNEAFRLYPNGPDVARYAPKDMMLGGYHIPKNCPLFIHTNLMLGFDEHFKNPEEFIPERWLRGHPLEAHVHPFLLTPFSFGPRMCIGRRIAEQDMAILTARLLSKYKVEWNRPEPLGQHFKILLVPDVEPRFRLIPRI